MRSNGLSVDDFISVIFTATSDVTSEFPAYAARQLGFGDVPLLCVARAGDRRLPAAGRADDGARRDRPAARGHHPLLPPRGGVAAQGPDPGPLGAGRMTGDRSGLTGPVLVVGTGLLGTSIALAARRAGLEVLLSDVSPEHLRTASGLGAGRPLGADGDEPQLVVVAVPPDHLGVGRRGGAGARRRAVVTDVGSVKSAPLRELAGTVGCRLRWPGTSARTRWPAASAPARWRRARRSSTDGPGRSPRTRGATPPPWSSSSALAAALRGDGRRAATRGARPGGRAYLPPAAPARRARGRAPRGGPRRRTWRCRGRAFAT